MGTILSLSVNETVIHGLAKEALLLRIQSRNANPETASSHSPESIDQDANLPELTLSSASVFSMENKKVELKDLANSKSKMMFNESSDAAILSSDDNITNNNNPSESKNDKVNKDKPASGPPSPTLMKPEAATKSGNNKITSPPGIRKADSKSKSPKSKNFVTLIESSMSSNDQKTAPGKILSQSKSGKLTKAKNSRELLKETLGPDGITQNIHPIEVKASFQLSRDCTMNFHYCFDPVGKSEFFKTDCCREKLKNMDITLDKNGNPDVHQFIKGLLKLSLKYQGTINLNGFEISSDQNPSNRLKISALDIDTSPMIMELSAKGVKGVTAFKSNSTLEIRGETEYGGKDEKWIRFAGKNAKDIEVVSPTGKGKLFVCIPTAPRLLPTPEEIIGAGATMNSAATI